MSSRILRGEGSPTWSELNAWRQMTGARITGQDAETVLGLADDYFAMLAKATKDPHMPPPYAVKRPDVKRVSSQIGNMLRTLAANKKGKKNGNRSR